MLVEILLACALPCREIPVPAPSLADGALHWLLDGAWAPPIRIPGAHPGAVLARLHAAIHGLDSAARADARPGALALAETPSAAAPGELAAVPEAWEEGLVDLAAGARFAAEGLACALDARVVARSRLADAPLRVAARGVWASLLPSGDDPAYERDLRRALAAPEAFGDLRRSLAAAGRGVAQRLGDGLAPLGPSASRVRVRVFERTDGLEELLRGLPDGARRHLDVVGATFARARPPGEVLRRRADGGVELWREDADAR